MRLLLDENVSPRLVPALRGDGHDVVHVRDMDWSGDPDHELWRRALADGRTFVTINARNFRKLAEAEEIHGGLLTFASGETPEGQLAAIRRLIAAVDALGSVNLWARLEDGRIVATTLPELR